MKRPIFTVQKHQASRLHYDFRLEIGGLLASWAIPKGPSLDPAMKRLAVQVDDHDLEYADFEGVIEEGAYGAGPVLVWDSGWFEVDGSTVARRSPEAMLKAGTLDLVLHGKRLKGGFALVRMKGRPKQWLLIKRMDDEARPGSDITARCHTSVLSGRTIEDLQHEAASGKLAAYRCE